MKRTLQSRVRHHDLTPFPIDHMLVMCNEIDIQYLCYVSGRAGGAVIPGLFETVTAARAMAEWYHRRVSAFHEEVFGSHAMFLQANLKI